MQTNATIETQVKIRKLRLLFKQSHPAVLFSLLAAILLSISVSSEADSDYLLIWLGSLLFISLVRAVMFLSFFQVKPEDPEVPAWEWVYVATLMISALVWGMGAWLISVPLSPELQSITYFFLMGMSGGSILVYSSIRILTLWTVFILLVPQTLWLLAYGNHGQFYNAIGCVLFVIATVRSTKVLSRALDESFFLSLELKQEKEKAEYQARVDHLTQLYNRRAFTDLAEKAILLAQRMRTPLSTIILDVDHFKSINDRFGHQTGDEVLRRVAANLTGTLRQTDLCGRFGGEEFIVLLPNTDLENAIKIAEKLRANLENMELSADEGAPLSITASFGVISGDENLDALVSRADHAMYQAKQSGRNRVVSG